MKIHHLAIWTKNIEEMKDFYVKYFLCKFSHNYLNLRKSFESYFLQFDDGTQIELMKMPLIPDNKNDITKQNLGLIHFAISVGSEINVDKITEKISNDGYTVISDPHFSGDGFYESCILDPENNRVEITV